MVYHSHNNKACVQLTWHRDTLYNFPFFHAAAVVVKWMEYLYLSIEALFSLPSMIKHIARDVNKKSLQQQTTAVQKSDWLIQQIPNGFSTFFCWDNHFLTLPSCHILSLSFPFFILPLLFFIISRFFAVVDEFWVCAIKLLSSRAWVLFTFRRRPLHAICFFLLSHYYYYHCYYFGSFGLLDPLWSLIIL